MSITNRTPAVTSTTGIIQSGSTRDPKCLAANPAYASDSSIGVRAVG